MLIDTSASMRRGDLWPQALGAGRQGDRRLPARPINWPSLPSTRRPGRCSSFHESATLDPARRQAVARATLDRLAPSWGGDEPGSGPDRRRRGDRRRGRHEREERPDAAPGRPDQRPSAGKPARGPRRLRMALGRRARPEDRRRRPARTRACRRSPSRSRPMPAATGTERRVRVLNDAASRQREVRADLGRRNGQGDGRRAGRRLRPAGREPRRARAPAQGLRRRTVCSG